MMEASTYTLLLVAIPFLGAALLGSLAWSKLQALKTGALLVTLGTLLTIIIGIAGEMPEPAVGISLLCLLPLAAFLSLLGQPLHPAHRIAWLMTLVLLGLGLGILAGPDYLRPLFLIVILGLISVLIYRSASRHGLSVWWGIGANILGMACLVTTLIAPAPLSSIALLVSCAILLPLFPFHAGYVAALTRLPGNLPAFLALLLPSLGFHGLLIFLQDTLLPLRETVIILALAGALYGSMKALAQSRASPLLAYASLAFFSILWWYLATTQSATPATVLYLAAVGLTTCGLLLAWYVVQARYGDMDLRAISGLAHHMPRFSILLPVLTLAAVGLPPFGVFAGFVGILMSPSLIWSWALLIVVVVWLTSAWYFIGMMQRLLYGQQRSDLSYEDLRDSEFASLLILVVVLIALGTVPSQVFDPGTTILQAYILMESPV